jgi:hypothetical protein
VERGGGGGRGNGILDGLEEAGLPASTFAALEQWGRGRGIGGRGAGGMLKEDPMAFTQTHRFWQDEGTG